MRYWMYKVGSNLCGDSGLMSMSFDVDADKMVDIKDNARPEVGKYMRVGTPFARSMQRQDWWQTNKVEEIIEDTPDYVKFRTLSGSIYEWKCD
jgi:hypothetical protein